MARLLRLVSVSGWSGPSFDSRELEGRLVQRDRLGRAAGGPVGGGEVLAAVERVGVVGAERSRSAALSVCLVHPDRLVGAAGGEVGEGEVVAAVRACRGGRRRARLPRVAARLVQQRDGLGRVAQAVLADPEDFLQPSRRSRGRQSPSPSSRCGSLGQALAQDGPERLASLLFGAGIEVAEDRAEQVVGLLDLAEARLRQDLGLPFLVSRGDAPAGRPGTGARRWRPTRRHATTRAAADRRHGRPVPPRPAPRAGAGRARGRPTPARRPASARRRRPAPAARRSGPRAAAPSPSGRSPPGAGRLPGRPAAAAGTRPAATAAEHVADVRPRRTAARPVSRR